MNVCFRSISTCCQTLPYLCHQDLFYFRGFLIFILEFSIFFLDFFMYFSITNSLDFILYIYLISIFFFTIFLLLSYISPVFSSRDFHSNYIVFGIDIYVFEFVDHDSTVNFSICRLLLRNFSQNESKIDQRVRRSLKLVRRLCHRAKNASMQVDRELQTLN